MTRRLRWSAIPVGLLLSLGTACDHRPRVTMPQGTYELPGEPMSSSGPRPAAPKEKPATPNELPRESPPPGDKK